MIRLTNFTIQTTRCAGNEAVIALVPQDQLSKFIGMTNARNVRNVRNVRHARHPKNAHPG